MAMVAEHSLSQGRSESDKCISALVQGVESGDEGREGRHKGEDTVTTPTQAVEPFAWGCSCFSLRQTTKKGSVSGTKWNAPLYSA